MNTLGCATQNLHSITIIFTRMNAYGHYADIFWKSFISQERKEKKTCQFSPWQKICLKTLKCKKKKKKTKNET